MSRESVLARVEADLADGDCQRAINRLRTLVHADPTDLGLRERLAAGHRRAGNPVEAGRWSYLGARIEREQEAFRRAHRSPWQRMRALAWSGLPDQVPSPASDRLRALAAEIEELTEGEVSWHEHGPPETHRESFDVGGLIALLAAAAGLALVAIGLITVLRWIF